MTYSIKFIDGNHKYFGADKFGNLMEHIVKNTKYSLNDIVSLERVPPEEAEDLCQTQ